MADSSEYTDPNVPLTDDQRRRIRDIARDIPAYVSHFIEARMRDSNELTGSVLSPEQREEQQAYAARLTETFTPLLKGAFEQIPYTTEMLTARLEESMRQLAAKAFSDKVTHEDSSFFSMVSTRYSQLCVAMEKEILFAPENLPTPPSRGRDH